MGFSFFESQVKVTSKPVTLPLCGEDHPGKAPNIRVKRRVDLDGGNLSSREIGGGSACTSPRFPVALQGTPRIAPAILVRLLINRPVYGRDIGAIRAARRSLISKRTKGGHVDCAWRGQARSRCTAALPASGLVTPTRRDPCRRHGSPTPDTTPPTNRSRCTAALPASHQA